MNWRAVLFPPKNRSFSGDRWLNILLRALHLVGIAGIGGGFLFNLPKAQYAPFWQLTLLSGGLLVLLYAWENGRWFLQVKGVSILLKLLLLVVANLISAWRAEIFTLIIILSTLIAHAPGKVRGFSPWGAKSC